MDRRPGRGLTAFGVVVSIGILFALMAGPLHLGLQAQTAGPSKLYWTDSFAKKIQSADLDGSNVTDLATDAEGLELPHGIAFDAGSAKIYWTDLGTGSIHRANPDGSAVETIVTDLDFPRWLAIDPNAGKLYWTDSARNTIGRANLDGSDRETLLSELANPFGIAVDPDGAKLYWIDATRRQILRADLDGSNVESFLTTADGIGDPVELALDSQSDHLYWTDPLMADQIQRVALDGSSEVETVVRRADSPQGLVVDDNGGKVYWAALETFSIQRADLDGAHRETVVADLSKPRGVALGN